ncbi:MAG: hypothetical protein M1827_003040 [Pycnora praestabilis]|nr:MAG: hypothetical protein M1827_003040 [Pycnora praestabilis]
MSLNPDLEKSYANIIDGILAASDINTISAARIRKGLQAAVDHDLTPQKDAIKELIIARFDKFNAERIADTTTSSKEVPTKPITNGHPTTDKKETSEHAQQISLPPSRVRHHTEDEDEDDYDLSDVIDKTPPKKKRKSEPVDEDALFAAKLQAEENSRARPTRGGTIKKRAVVKKKKNPVKSKSISKVKAEDDSDLNSGSEVEKKKVKRTGGFHKPMNLSPALSQLLDGETTLSRPETVSRIWKHIKERDLQDPNDKREIQCDDRMKAVFKQDRVHMFKMNKLLSSHFHAPDE